MLRALTARSPFLLGASLLFLCSLAYVASRPLFNSQVAGNVRMRDFVSPYTGARCLLVGCDPYDLSQIQTEFAKSGGTDADHAPWDWEPPVYPPSSLVVLLPFAIFPFHVARALWFGFGLAALCGAILTTVYFVEPRQRPWAIILCAVLLPCKFVAELVGIGQPSAAAIGLAAISLLLFWTRRAPVIAIALLGVSLALKPQVALAIFLLLLFRRRTTKAAVLAGTAAALIMVLGAGWLSIRPASRKWLSDYRSQISTSVAGGVNDPSWTLPHGRRMLNLQASLAGFTSPRATTVLSWITAALLFLLWVRSYTRNFESLPALRDSLAAILCITFLPIYHRDYDLPMLMLTFPALLILCGRRSLWGFAILLLTLALVFPPRPPTALWGHFGNKPGTAKFIPNENLRVLLLARQEPLILLCLAVFYTALLTRQSPRYPIQAY